MKTEVSNELILQAHKEACDKWKGIIEKECPSLFPKKVKVGQWWKYENYRFRVKEVISWGFYIDNSNYKNEEQVVGFSSDVDRKMVLMTKEEIESHLIKEAEKRGFKVGTRFFNNQVDGGAVPENNPRVIEEYRFSYHDRDELKMHGWIIYANGKWATILSEPKVIELTLEDIAKLKGVDVSLIKIVK